MLRILGIPLADADVRWLIGERYRDAHAPAVLGVLDDPPDGLAELRGALMREQ